MDCCRVITEEGQANPLCYISFWPSPSIFWYSMGGWVDVIAAGWSVPGGHSIQLVLDDTRTVEGRERTNLRSKLARWSQSLLCCQATQQFIVASLNTTQYALKGYYFHREGKIYKYKDFHAGIRISFNMLRMLLVLLVLQNNCPCYGCKLSKCSIQHYWVECRSGVKFQQQGIDQRVLSSCTWRRHRFLCLLLFG